MKKYISIIVLLSLFVVGCSEQTSVNSTANNVNVSEPSWITLPASNDLVVNAEWKVSKKITGSVGGYISKGVSYSGVLGKITIQSRIDFSPNAFSGSPTITLTINDQNTSVQFGPSMEFIGDVYYNVTYTGLNLKGIDPSTVKFAYLATDGSVVYAKNEGIKVDLSTGTLSVYNALIPHFSRYGFINGTAD